MHIVHDFVRETTSTTGTGTTIALTGSVDDSLTFGSVMSDGDTCDYYIEDPGVGREAGIATYVSASNELTLEVRASTNSNNRISLSGNAKIGLGMTAAPGGLTLYQSKNAADEELGQTKHDGNDSAGNRTTYAKDQAEIETATDGAEDGRRSFWSMIAGTLTKVLVIGKGLYTPNATGGDQGADTINVSSYYRDGVKVLPPQLKFKTADETVNNSTSVQNDDHLSFSVGANESVSFEIKAFIRSNATADFKFDISGSQTPTNIIYGANGIESGNSGSQNAYNQTLGISTDGDTVINIFGTIENGATSDSVNFRWAQSTADASDTTLKRGSYLLVYRH